MSQQPPPMRVLPVMPVYTRFDNPRPGAITAIGVISIIISVLTGLVSLIAIGFAIATFAAASVQTVLTTASATAYPVTATISSSNPSSLTPNQARAIVSGFRMARGLNTDQSEQLQSLAEKYGKKMFSFDPTMISAQRIHDNISDSGEFLGGAGKRQNYYIIGSGRVEVGDNLATFRTDASDVFRSTDVLNDASLSEDSIAAVITQANQYLSQPLNSAQDKSLRTLLRDPNQVVIANNQSPYIYYGGNLPDNSGTIWMMTNKSVQLRLDQSGNPTLLNSSAPLPGTNPFTGKKITTTSASGLVIVSIVDGLIAILLLVAAIQFLRGRPIGRKLTLIYSFFQIPLAILLGVLVGLTTSEWIAAKSNTPSPDAAIAWLVGILTLIAGLFWPMVCLIVVNKKSIREYFAGVM